MLNGFNCFADTPCEEGFVCEPTLNEGVEEKVAVGEVEKAKELLETSRESPFSLGGVISRAAVGMLSLSYRLKMKAMEVSR